MNVFIARIAGVVAAALVTWLIGKMGLPVSEEQKASAVEWLTHGLTGLGALVFMLTYGAAHKVASKRTNPADTAKAPEASAHKLNLPPS